MYTYLYVTLTDACDLYEQMGNKDICVMEIFDNNVQWTSKDDAVAACHQYGMDLVEMGTEQDNVLLTHSCIANVVA